MTGLLDNMSDRDLLSIAEFYGGKKRQFGFARSDLVEMGRSIYRSGIPRNGSRLALVPLPNGIGNGPARFLSRSMGRIYSCPVKSFQRGERK